MQLSIAIVNFRTPELVIACLESVAVEREALPSLRAVVVDNQSGDHSIDLLGPALAAPAFRDWVEFLPLPLNGGFGWGNNQAILHMLQGPSPPDAVLLLNPDTRIEPGAIAALAAQLERHPDAGAIGSQLLDEDGTPSGSAFRFPSIGREFVRGCDVGTVGLWLGIAPSPMPLGQAGPVDWVTGAGVLLRTAALREAGLFDTGFFLYFEEVELMHRLRRHGWLCYHCPDSRITHVAGAATGIVNGRSKDRPAPPDYLFGARRRYFALTGGRGQALLANLAWIAGTLLGRVIVPLLRGRAAFSAAAERKALFRLGLSATMADATPAVARVEDPPGLRPAWMP